MNKPIVQFQDLGRIRYKEAWDYQTSLHQGIIAQKLENRKKPEEERVPTANHLLFCEHDPVFTLGKSGHESNLLISRDLLSSKGIDFHEINRGGDITYHGPGQLTGYPIFDLENFFTDIGKYLRLMEASIIQVLALYGLQGERIDGLTGVWLDAQHPTKARKIAAIGVHSSRWVTMHGFGFNITADLSPFSLIVPCGIRDKGVTSLHLEVDGVDFETVKNQVRAAFAEQYNFEERG
jgi:lipoyl(octanoyl) transferase